MLREEELELRLAKLKEYASEVEFKNLNKRIYELNLPDEFLTSLPKNSIVYIHVKLHNSLSYKKPFASVDRIREVHKRLVVLLPKHFVVDSLDV